MEGIVGVEKNPLNRSLAVLNVNFAAEASLSELRITSLIYRGNSILPCDTTRPIIRRYEQRDNLFGRSAHLRLIASGIRDWLLRES